MNINKLSYKTVKKTVFSFDVMTQKYSLKSTVKNIVHISQINTV